MGPSTPTELPAPQPTELRLQPLWGLVRMARPYSQLWFVAVPTATIALWLLGDAVVWSEVLVLAAAFSLTDAGLTTVNDLCDRDTDLASSEAQRNTRPMAAGTVPMRWAYAEAIVLEAGALSLAWTISPLFAALLAAGVVYGILYSARPVRLGGRPVWSQFFWVLLWPAYFLGSHLALGGDLGRGWVYILATVVFMGVAETLAKDLRDLENDRATGKRTTPVAIGPSRAAALCFPAFCLGSALYVLCSFELRPLNPALTLALCTGLGMWCMKAFGLCRSIERGYSLEASRALHEGAIVTFTTVNLLLVVGLHGSGA